MDYKQKAEQQAAIAGGASGDRMTTAETATVDALMAIAYALLHMAETVERVPGAMP